MTFHVWKSLCPSHARRMPFWAQTRSLHHSQSQRLEARATHRALCSTVPSTSCDQTSSSISIKHGKSKTGSVLLARKACPRCAGLSQATLKQKEQPQHSPSRALAPHSPAEGTRHLPGGTPVCSSPRGTGTAVGRQPGSSQLHRTSSSQELLLQRQHHLQQQQKSHISSTLASSG